MVQLNRMIRAVVYSVTGALLGISFGFAAGLFAGAEFLFWTIGGGIVGTLLGLALAWYVTSRNLFAGPFMTVKDADGLAYMDELYLRGSLLPTPIANWWGKRFRNFVESHASNSEV